MLGFSIFVIVTATLVFLFRLKREREIEAFRDADFVDLVGFDADIEGATADEVADIAAGVVAPSARTIGHRNVNEVPGSPGASVLYRKREAVFDDVTRTFLLTLYQLLGYDYQVLIKVPVTDLVRSRDPADVNVLSPSEKVDFVICRKTDLTVVCGVQLAGGAVDGIATIFDQVNIPFVTLSVGAAYSVDELRDKLEGLLPTTQTVQICSGCDRPMSKKVARSGKREG